MTYNVNRISFFPTLTSRLMMNWPEHLPFKVFRAGQI